MKMEQVTGWEEDGLIGGDEYPLESRLVKVKTGVRLNRGDLICADSLNDAFEVAGETDVEKVLLIAAEDSEKEVTQAYSGGIFNRERITFGGASLAIEPFEQALRLQNIHLRTLN